MKVEIWYCEKCEVQAEKIETDRRMYEVRCPECAKVITHKDIIYTDVKIPKPHIEKGTLIKLLNGPRKALGSERVVVFEEFTPEGLASGYCYQEGYFKSENYELISPDEINPAVKHGEGEK